MAWLEEDPHERFREQFEIVREGLARADPDDPDELPGIAIVYEEVDRVPRYVYQDCGILVPDEYTQVANDRLGATVVPRRGGNRSGGVQLMHLPDRGARDAVDLLRRENGVGAAALNHVLSIAADGGVNMCPADEPVPGEHLPHPPSATGAAGHGGRGVRVLVIDTGLLPDAGQTHPWLAGVTGGSRLGGAPLGDIPIYRGHGTFIAGVLRCVAPEATVEVANDFRRAGALTEMDLVDALRDVLDLDEPPDIVSLSAGGYLQDARRGPALERVIADLRARAEETGGPVLVAAAGNDGHDDPTRPFLPAALPGVIAVGALRRDLRGRACFSNHGEWVRVFAPGEGLVNAFPAGSYTYVHGGLETCRYRRRSDPAWYPGCTCVTQPNKGTQVAFRGMAQWSGTSFATPVVAGLIAARVTRSRENGRPETAREAADWLLAHPARTIDGVGDVVLPDQYLG